MFCSLRGNSMKRSDVSRSSTSILCLISPFPAPFYASFEYEGFVDSPPPPRFIFCCGLSRFLINILACPLRTFYEGHHRSPVSAQLQSPCYVPFLLPLVLPPWPSLPLVHRLFLLLQADIEIALGVAAFAPSSSSLT
jgi:hypothetical protein